MRRMFFTVIIAALALYVVYPYFTLWRLLKAIETRDIFAIEMAVDWNSVKQGLRRDFLGSLPKTGINTSGGEILGTAFAGPIFDSMIDGLVNPAYLFRLAEGKSISAIEGTAWIRSAWFRSLSQFEVQVAKPSSPAPYQARAIFSFDGLEWKISRITIADILPESNLLPAAPSLPALPKADRERDPRQK